jgi:hypothetical protein
MCGYRSISYQGSCAARLGSRRRQRREDMEVLVSRESHSPRASSVRVQRWHCICPSRTQGLNLRATQREFKPHRATASAYWRDACCARPGRLRGERMRVRCASSTTAAGQMLVVPTATGKPRRALVGRACQWCPAPRRAVLHLGWTSACSMPRGQS